MASRSIRNKASSRAVSRPMLAATRPIQVKPPSSKVAASMVAAPDSGRHHATAGRISQRHRIRRLPEPITFDEGNAAAMTVCSPERAAAAVTDSRAPRIVSSLVRGIDELTLRPEITADAADELLLNSAGDAMQRFDMKDEPALNEDDEVGLELEEFTDFEERTVQLPRIIPPVPAVGVCDREVRADLAPQVEAALEMPAQSPIPPEGVVSLAVALPDGTAEPNPKAALSLSGDLYKQGPPTDHSSRLYLQAKAAARRAQAGTSTCAMAH